MPKKGMGCWCPSPRPNGFTKIVILLDIMAIILIIFIAFTIEENWLVYMPTVLLVLGALLLIVSNVYWRK